MTILLLETLDQTGLALLEKVAPVILSPTPFPHLHDLPFGEVTAIITRGLGKLDEDLINKCPKLKIIARCGAGLDNLDVRAAHSRNIKVVYAPGINAVAVAEHSLMLMLNTVRQGFATGSEVKRDNWACRNNFSGDDLTGKKICIVGAGNIGRKTAELCRPFSDTIQVCGRDGKGHAGLVENLQKYLPTSDVVSLHIPLNDETRGMFDRSLLSFLKPGAILINTARGELVNEGALLENLEAENIAAYAADVVDGEPPKAGNPLIAHPRSFITPHVAALTKRTYQEMCVFTARNVVAVLTEGSPEPASIYRGAA